jgi:type VI secretion system protein ImpG
MEELLSYYEREIGIFRAYSRQFAQRYPKTAGQLLIAGEHSEDPHIERLIQSFALLTARVSKRLDSDYPQFTESMLESLYPHYLRPLPSYSVVQMTSAGQENGDAASVLPRGIVLQSAAINGVASRFKTVYDVNLGPLAATKFVFSAFHDESALAGRLPPQATSAIKLTIGLGDQSSSLHATPPSRLRLFVNAEPSLRGVLLDTLLMRTAGVFVQADGAGAWTPLASSPLSLAGLEEDDAMLPFSARSNCAFRLLTEYFSYPEKFNFLDLDLAAIAERLPARCQCLTLYFALADVPADSTEARLLASVSPKILLPGCTPVINLFDKAGVPFQQTHTAADHALLADATHASGYDIHTVKAVRLVREAASGNTVTEFTPLYTIGHGADDIDAHGCYWLTRRDELVAAISPGHEVRLTLVDPHARAGGGVATVSTELSCTNRDLPSQLQIGAPGGDLRSDEVPTTTVVRLLRKPTPPYRFANGNSAHWRLIAHLTLNLATLTRAGVGDLQKMLSLYDLPQSATSRRQIRGIVAIESGTVRAWMPTVPTASLMVGVGIRMTLDEQAFAGSAIVIFARVMERYFSLNRQLNCFTQLEIISAQSGKEILTCQPRCSEELSSSI